MRGAIQVDAASTPVDDDERIADLLAAPEVPGIARHEFELMFQGGRRDYGIGQTNGAANPFQLAADHSRHLRGGLVKRDDFLAGNPRSCNDQTEPGKPGHEQRPLG